MEVNKEQVDNIKIMGMTGLRDFMYVVLDNKKENKIPKKLCEAIDWRTTPIEIEKPGFKIKGIKLEIEGTHPDLDVYSDLFSHKLREDGSLVPTNKKAPYVAVGCIANELGDGYQVDILSNIRFSELEDHYHTQEERLEFITKKLVGISETGKFNNKDDDKYPKSWIKNRFKTEDEAKKYLCETLKELKRSKRNIIYILEWLVFGLILSPSKLGSWFFKPFFKNLS